MEPAAPSPSPPPADADEQEVDHELVKNLALLEGDDLDEAELAAAVDGGADYYDEDDYDAADGKKKRPKKAAAAAAKHAPKSAANKAAAAAAAAAAPEKPRGFADSHEPSPPPLKPAGRSFETDVSEVRRWMVEAVDRIGAALDTPESISEARARRVVAEYAAAMRSAAETLARLEARYREMHRVFVAYSYDARLRETYGERRGAGAFAPMAK